MPLAKLQNKLLRLPRTLSKDQVTAIERRLKALPGTGSGGSMALPKGPDADAGAARPLAPLSR